MIILIILTITTIIVISFIIIIITVFILSCSHLGLGCIDRTKKKEIIKEIGMISRYGHDPFHYDSFDDHTIHAQKSLGQTP